MGEKKLLTKQEIRLMPFTFIAAPVVIIAMSLILVVTYNEMIDEKIYIVNLSCPQLQEYTQVQQFESKLYHGHEAYLKFAQERYKNLC